MGLWQSVERGVEEEDEAGPGGEAEEEVRREPEWVPFASSASSSPLSPQLVSSSRRIQDAGGVLIPLPSSPCALHTSSIPKPRRLGDHRLQTRSFAGNFCAEIYVVGHGECTVGPCSDLIAGRSPSAVLTAEGKRQARALGIFLLSQGVHFDAAISSSLERCKQTAAYVCEEVNFPREKIEFSDALAEMSQGHWEGLRHSDVYTTEVFSVMANSLLDFHAPDGESLRQVEFRMIEFLNNSVLPRAAEKARKLDSPGSFKNVAKEKSHSLMQVHPLNEDDERCMRSITLPPSWYRHTLASEGRSALHMLSTAETTDTITYDEDSRFSLSSFTSNAMFPTRMQEGKAISNPGHKSSLYMLPTSESTDTVFSDENGKLSALQSTSNNAISLQMLEGKGNMKSEPFYVCMFSHAIAIKCLIRGLLGSDPYITHRLHIDNTSVTVLRYSHLNGWQIQRINDTAHLCLL